MAGVQEAVDFYSTHDEADTRMRFYMPSMPTTYSREMT